MKQYFLFILILTLSLQVQSQDTIELKSDTLLPLTKPKEVLLNYLNFDVLKVLVGTGRGVEKDFHYSRAVLVRGQLLCPYAFSKRFLKIAYGISFGSNKMTLTAAEPKFSDGRIKEIVSSAGSTDISTTTIGLTLLRVTRCNAFTFYTGFSAEYITKGKMQFEDGNSKYGHDLTPYINRWSVPVHLQVSLSKKQFLSIGVFGKYDTQSLFKGDKYDGVRYLTFGASLGVII